MFLTMLKRVVKAVLHDAVDEWAIENGLPQVVVDEMRSRRLAHAAQADATADAHAALTLGVDDEEEAHILPISAQVVTAGAEECPPPGDESVLLHWVHRQRERQIGWAEITQRVEHAGHAFNLDALPKRYRRWREQNHSPTSDPPPAA